MSDRFGAFDDDDIHTAGQYAAYARSTSRYGRRHHDQDDRWSRYTQPTQDMD